MIPQRTITQDIEVSKEDQQNINNFSKLNTLFHEKQKELKEKKELLEQLGDALTELELMDDDETVSIRFGECFFGLKAQDSREYVEKNQETCKKELEGVVEKTQEVQKKMGKLKASLYAKFGASINLEEE